MDANNMFFKMLMFSVSSNDFVLLYGFGAYTQQATYGWRRKEESTRKSIFTAILAESDAGLFLKSLTQPGFISLGKYLFKSPELVERPITISNNRRGQERGPTTECGFVREFWKIQKNEVLKTVETAFNSIGKQLYIKMVDLLEWLKKECGVDFFDKGYRFGNFEFYEMLEYADAFDVTTLKAEGLKRTIVTKNYTISKDVIVNCTAKHRGRTISNQTKLFPADCASLDFCANEPMSHAIVQVWDAESGALFYSYDTILMMNMHFNINVASTPRSIRDKWSDSLLSSASNRKDIIEKSIITVSPNTQALQNTINSSTYNIIDRAIAEGSNLFSGYKYPKTTGAFISNQQKDGEINSFIKIREYIEVDSVNKVIIADPYFSFDAAERILTRISRNNVSIEVIASFGDKEPDSGKKMDVCEYYKVELERIRYKLHERLLICNLKRGLKQVFHDRYLIRIFDNGKIDGFMLGNSLNSMGVSYPFAIVPLEKEICLEVYGCIKEMMDQEAQAKQNKRERIKCEILFEKKVYSPNIATEPLPLKDELAQWYELDSTLSVSEDVLLLALSKILDCWENKRQEACQALCVLRIKAYIPDSVLIEAIRDIPGLEDTFINTFVELAREREPLHKHNNIESNRYLFWALLNGNAQPCKIGVSTFFDRSGHMFYSNDSWLRGGYRLLLLMNPLMYVELFDEIKSPLMLDVLTIHLLFAPWSESFFDAITKTEFYYLRVLYAESIMRQIMDGKLSYVSVQEAFIRIAPDKRAVAIAYLISRTAFYSRIDNKLIKDSDQFDAMRLWLDDCFVEDISRCSDEARITAIDWLFESEANSNCRLHINVAVRVKDASIKKELLEKAIKIAKDGLLAHTDNTGKLQLIETYLDAVELLYGENAEDVILSDIAAKKDFETATEPLLVNYDFDRWNRACNRAQCQMIILKAYIQKHPEAAKAKDKINEWEGRMNNV